MKKFNLNTFRVTTGNSVREVMTVIDRNRTGIALVTDIDGKLIGTVTDGDIRRFILSGGSLNDTCETIMSHSPFIAKDSDSFETLRHLIKRHQVRHMPVVDSAGRPVDIISASDFVDGKNGQVAVIMAGGEGKRLLPLTEDIPKPMVPVGGRPLLEQTVEQLRISGVAIIYLSVNYRADVIKDHFGDGGRFGVEIRYIEEKTKLGTAGSLTLLPEIPQNPLLVMNGDVVTNVNYERILDFHRHHRCVMTVAATEYKIKVPFGALNLADHFILGIDEKPTHRFLCNAGIYVIDPELLRFIPADSPYDMTDLLQRTIREGMPNAAFPVHEYWIDVGRKNDLDRACEDAALQNGNQPSQSGDTAQ